MTMSEVGRRDQHIDPVNGGDVAADGTLLSVAEIQQRFREERARRGLAAPPRRAADPDAPPAAAPTTTATAVLDPPPAEPQRVIVRGPAPDAEPEMADTHTPTAPAPVHPPVSRKPPAPATATTAGSGSLDLPASWVRVLAGHSGAGASTIALAIADAAAASGRPSQLIETAPASRSGLVSAASRELDIDATGAWRRGTRPNPTTAVHVTIDRRTEDQPPTAWPSTESPSPHEQIVTVDLGFVSGEALGRAAGGPIVVTCRATIPGVRLTEQLLNRLTEAAVVVAVLGARRWPGEVTASCGPQLRALRAAGQVVTVPLDGHLAITGPTHVPLPKAVLAVGRDVLGLLDSAHDGAASPTAHRALRPRKKGTPR
jgi:hypothetical protein